MQARRDPIPAIWVRPALFLATVGLVALAARTPILLAFENRLYDLRAHAASAWYPAAPDVVLVALDNQSLEEFAPDLGRWPWPRAVFAAVLDYCSEAAVIGFDLLFTEPDWQWPKRDQVFVDEVHRHGRVVNPIFVERRKAETATLERLQPFGMGLFEGVDLPAYSGVLLPFDDLLTAGHAVGHVNHEADRDGVARTYMTAVRCGSAVYPSLALTMVTNYLHIGRADLAIAPPVFRLGDRTIPVTRDGRVRLRYTDCRYTTYSIADVLASWQLEGDAVRPVPRDAFKDKLVLIGSTATGLEEDMEVTPITRALPGMLIHANAIDNLLQGVAYRTVPFPVEMALVALLAVLPLLLRLARPKWMVLTGLFLIGLYGGLVTLALARADLMLPVTAPILALLLSSIMLSMVHWYGEMRRRAHLESLENAKQQFTDMLVHDLKNRVSAITMSMSMLDRQVGDVEEPVLKSIRTAQAGGKRLLDQVYALLDIRRMEEGRMALDRKPCDLWGLLEDCAQEYHEAANLLGVELRVDRVDSTSFFATLDPEIFLRILGNLVWNALQYAKRGTVVLLQARPAGAQRVDVVVANRGRSIPREIQETVFEAFVAGTKEGKQGRAPSIGLGLAFCRLACEAQGGGIRIESPWQEGEEGVKVIVDFPLTGIPADAGV